MSTLQDDGFPSMAALRTAARDRLPHAHVPYSRQPAAAVVGLSDGTLVGGVRIENASYSLTISAVMAAVARAVAMGRHDIACVFILPDASPAERAYLRTFPLGGFEETQDGLFVRRQDVELPAIGAPTPAVDDISPIELARLVRERAVIQPGSPRFGCVVIDAKGERHLGVNVEHPDWTFVMCAERAAIAAARSAGNGQLLEVYLSSSHEASCIPCGACRQVLSELAPNAVLWMDRGSEVRRFTPSDLLPYAFHLATASGDA